MRVLLVEDDPMIGESIRVGLLQDGFSVDWVRDGLTAECAVRGAAYDAMLLDLGLPRKQGLQVLQTIRGKGDQTPVLIVTAHDAVSERISGLDSGADDYIIKPFDLDELAARIRAVSRRRIGRVESVIEYGALVLNPASHEAMFRGAALPLSAREFAILVALVERPGVLLSRSRLEDKLYGWGDEVASNTIEVYIHSLRKKLGRNFIRNLRGAGYSVPKVPP